MRATDLEFPSQSVFSLGAIGHSLAEAFGFRMIVRPIDSEPQRLGELIDYLDVLLGKLGHLLIALLSVHMDSHHKATFLRPFSSIFPSGANDLEADKATPS